MSGFVAERMWVKSRNASDKTDLGTKQPDVVVSERQNNSDRVALGLERQGHLIKRHWDRSNTNSAMSSNTDRKYNCHSSKAR